MSYNSIMAGISRTQGKQPYAILVLGASFLSLAPVFVKMLQNQVIGLTAIAFWRMFLGGLILFGLSALRGRNLKLPRTAYPWAALAGLLFCLDLTFWHRSIVYAGAGLSTILANTQVFNTAVLSYLFLKEKLSYKFFIAAFSALFGVALLVGVTSDVEFTETYMLGVFLGLLTGVVYAGYLVTLKRAGQDEIKPDFMTFMAWVSIFSAIFLAVAASFETGALLPSGLYTWSVLLLLAMIVQTLGWWAVFSSLQKVEVSRAGLVLLMQPLLATVWGAWFFAEHLATGQIAGAAITLAAIYYGSIYRR